MSIEKRYAAGIEHRASTDKKTLAGYAALFGVQADIGGYFREVVAPGAFDGTLGDDVRALFDHDSGRVLGRTKAGSLRLATDDKGLKVEIDLPDTTDGRDVYALVERGDISGMSFGFEVTKQEWDETGDVPVRTILAVKLHEVSAVTWPAYPDTSIATRSLDEFRAAHPVKTGAAIRARMKMKHGLRTRAA